MLRASLDSLALNAGDSFESKLSRQEGIAASSALHQSSVMTERRYASHPSQLRPAAGARIKFLQKSQFCAAFHRYASFLHHGPKSDVNTFAFELGTHGSSALAHECAVESVLLQWKDYASWGIPLTWPQRLSH